MIKCYKWNHGCGRSQGQLPSTAELRPKEYVEVKQQDAKGKNIPSKVKRMY